MPYPLPLPDAGPSDDAGLVVRPYAVTSGRTRPRSGRFDLISIIAATRPVPIPGPGRGPEQLAILRLCQRPASVAEVAAGVDLPLSVVRVLLGDLLDEGQIAVRQPQPAEQQLSDETLEAMIDGLRAL